MFGLLLFRKLLRHHGILFMQAMREYEKDRLGISHRLGHGGIILLEFNDVHKRLRHR